MAKQSSAKLVKRARSMMARSRQREKDAMNMAIGKGSGIIIAAGTGAFEDKIPVTIAKIPTKLIGAAGLYLLSAFTKGGVSKAADAAGDSLKDIYAYKVAMQARMKTDKPFVAGDDDDDETGYVYEL